jgi:hypothetical protein
MLFRFALRRIPFAKRKFEEKAKKLELEFHEEFEKFTQKKTFRVPTGGVKYSTLQERLKTWYLIIISPISKYSLIRSV